MSLNMIPHELSMLVSSDPTTGARNVSPSGSNFDIVLEDALSIPPQAHNVTVSVDSATVWWTIPNIVSGVNDLMRVTRAGDPNSPYNIVIPQGLYDLSGLNAAIIRELTNLGAPFNPLPLFELQSDDATQKVAVLFHFANVSIDFTIANSFRDILGFNSQVIGSAAIVPITIIAPNVAAFNQVNYFLIHSDLVQKGIRFNNTYSQVIGQVLIDVAPGSQIVSQPFNTAKVNADELAGNRRTILRFQLTDDKNREVNTNGEAWTARIVIRYFIPFVMEAPAHLAR